MLGFRLAASLRAPSARKSACQSSGACAGALAFDQLLALLACICLFVCPIVGVCQRVWIADCVRPRLTSVADARVCLMLPVVGSIEFVCSTVCCVCKV